MQYFSETCCILGIRHAVSSKVQGTVKVRKFKKVWNLNSTQILICNPALPPAFPAHRSACSFQRAWDLVRLISAFAEVKEGREVKLNQVYVSNLNHALIQQWPSNPWRCVVQRFEWLTFWNCHCRRQHHAIFLITHFVVDVHFRRTSWIDVLTTSWTCSSNLVDCATSILNIIWGKTW